MLRYYSVTLVWRRSLDVYEWLATFVFCPFVCQLRDCAPVEDLDRLVVRSLLQASLTELGEWVLH